MKELKELIKDIVEEALLIEEDKTHIIKKMPKVLSWEKDTLIRLFQANPHLEKMIDWNKWRKLTFEDFQEVMTYVSKSERKKDVRKRLCNLSLLLSRTASNSDAAIPIGTMSPA